MVRLSKKEIEAIKSSVHALDPEAKIILFGSRVDLAKKGGDIDLLIFSKHLDSTHTIDIKRRLFEQIEEQKVDIIIVEDDTDPFVIIALSKGKEL